MSVPVLEVRGLTVAYSSEEGEEVVLVEDASFSVDSGTVLCIVGESGSGKSVTMLAVMGLLPEPLRIVSGEILHRGRDIGSLPEPERRKMRGKDMAMVFQDPMTALNPVRRVGQQIARALAVHQPRLSRRERNDQVADLLASVGVPQPAMRARGYPHEWSGGMRQRAVIAMAIANSPDLLIADEPTTALDTTVQAQVMDALARARSASDAAMVLITHDLGLVAQVADQVSIMYSGRIVEAGSVWDVFDKPSHPYTQGLLASILAEARRDGPAYAIPGSPPPPTARPDGCAFALRCTNAGKDDLCSVRPDLSEVGVGHDAACHHIGAELLDLTAGVSR